MAATAPTSQFGTRNGDNFDTRLAHLRISIIVAVIGHYNTWLEGQYVVAILPLLALHFKFITSSGHLAQVLESQGCGNDFHKGPIFLRHLNLCRCFPRPLGLSTILWNVDPRDWSRPGTSVIIQNVLTATRNGSIILLHDGGGDRSQTVAALPTIITTLEQRGFQFVTIPRLIQGLPPGGTGPTLIAPDQLSS